MREGRAIDEEEGEKTTLTTRSYLSPYPTSPHRWVITIYSGNSYSLSLAIVGIQALPSCAGFVNERQRHRGRLRRQGQR